MAPDTFHASATTIHRAGYIADADPGAVGANKTWYQTTGGVAPVTEWIRNAANSGWIQVSNSTGIPATIVDAKGDLIAATAADTVARLPVGTNNQVLTADSVEATGIKWAAPASSGHVIKDETISLTARANLNFAGAGVVATDNAGTSSTDVTIPGGIAATLIDAKGDLLAGTAADTITRLGVGTNNQALLADSAQSTGLGWGDVVRPAIVDAKGDLLAGTAADTVARLAVGSNGQHLSADSAEVTGLKWVTPAVTGGAYAVLVGDGVATQITVTHNLSTRDIAVAVQDAATFQIYTPGPDMLALTTNTVRLDFASAPATNSLRVTVIAGGVGAGSSAPVDASYVVGAANGTLSAELVLGSAVVMSGDYASLPAASLAGRLYLPTNSLYQILRDNGASWDYWHITGQKLTLPTASYSWGNQGSATVSNPGGHIYLEIPGGTAAIRGRFITTPTPPYTITALFLPQVLGSTAHCGLYWRASGSGAIETLGIWTDTVWRWSHYSAYGTFVTHKATRSATGSYWMAGVWLRLRDDNTTRYAEISMDGTNWSTLGSEARTTTLTPNEIGFYADTNGSALVCAVNLMSWEVS